MERIVGFLATPLGRWIRIGAGAALVASGVRSRRPELIAVGALPLLGGLFDFVLPAVLVGLPPGGPVLRRELGMLPKAPLVPRRGPGPLVSAEATAV
jgi:hypothetical protein